MGDAECSGSPTQATLKGVPLVCPRDGAALRVHDQELRCCQCTAAYPIVGGVPVLLNEGSSVFSIADYTGAAAYQGAGYGRDERDIGRGRRLARQIISWLGDAPSTLRRPHTEDALAYARALAARPTILVIGSGGVRLGAADDLVVHTDVAFGPAVDAIVDAHDLPFPAGSFDMVIACAVLEHVADPQRCVAEIWRVLAADGHVFAATPFLQPVHMGAYDFTRFTPIGHRRLFRHFDEVGAGVSVGMGSVTAWMFRALLHSVSSNRVWRGATHLLSLVCGLPLRLLDRWFAHGDDAAGGYWFLGRRRSDGPVPDRDLVLTYRAQFAHSNRHALPAPPR